MNTSKIKTMKKEDAIKFLQQLYPNGGHCWLDEQRMEAIGMAVKALQEEPESIWHDANEEPNNMSHCLVFYGDKSLIGHYLHYEPVLYNKQDKVFVTVAYPHQTGYKVEQKSLDGGCVAEVHKDKRDRISISDITSWCYLNDLHNLTQKEEHVSEEFEKIVEEIAEPTILNAYGTKELARRLRNTICGTSVSEDLEDAAEKYAYELFPSVGVANSETELAFKEGAKWQFNQLEKNRLKHCNSITNEQAELEQGFIDQHLDKHQRMPTFLDAIEYGMILQKQKMMAKAIDAHVNYAWSGLDFGGFDWSKTGLDLGDKCKLIIIKED